MTKEMEKHNNLLFVMLFIVALVATLFLVYSHKTEVRIRSEQARSDMITKALDGVEVGARAFAVYNITQSRPVYGRNGDEVLPIASIAKILTVVVGLQDHKNEKQIYISQNAVKENGDFGIFANEKWDIDDVARFTLIASANDGAYALAEKDSDFIDKLNTKAKKIGAENTLFINPTGLDIDIDHPGAMASAEDVNAMATYAIKSRPDIFETTTKPEINLKSLSGFDHNFKNTNTIVDKIPNLLLSKTGHTELAGGNLVIVFRNEKGEEIAVTVLGSTLNGRFEDMEKIVNVLYSL